MRPEILLAFEAAHPRQNGNKETAIRAEFGIGPARYYQLLHRAASTPEGMLADPVTARQVRDRAERRAATREQRTAPAA